MSNRVKVTLGIKQAEALFEAALFGLADIGDQADNGDRPLADYRKADEALTVLARAVHAAREANSA